MLPIAALCLGVVGPRAAPRAAVLQRATPLLPRAAPLSMVSSWYDEGKRLDGTTATADAPADDGAVPFADTGFVAYEPSKMNYKGSDFQRPAMATTGKPSETWQAVGKAMGPALGLAICGLLTGGLTEEYWAGFNERGGYGDISPLSMSNAPGMAEAKAIKARNAQARGEALEQLRGGTVSAFPATTD